MGDTHHHQSATSSRLGIRGGGGEIVEVQGGHIVRSTGRKDRHSKVCTAKGPRDRRVRLSAHTAIQFYDVQDRLGYDRPSKAVDWLIKKAKAAIDELAELPAWTPTTTTTASKQNQQQQERKEENETQNPIGVHRAPVHAIPTGSRRATTSQVGSDMRNLQSQLDEDSNCSSSFLPPSLDSDAIADTIKSFFPMGTTAAEAEPPPSSSVQFHNCPPHLLSRTSSHNQDLQLSLHSFQDPILIPLHHQSQHQAQSHHQNQQVLFSGANPLGFNGTSSTGWPEQHHPAAELGRFHRLVAWNTGAETGSGGHGGVGIGSGGGFIFDSPPSTPLPSQMPPPLQPLFGQNQFFSQRGPLQSSNTPSIRAWIDPSIATSSISDHLHHHHPHAMHQSSVSVTGFASGGFSGFRIPARIQGEEEHDGIHKPSSASSGSRH